MTRRQNRRVLGRYAPLLHDPADPDGGWVVWDSYQQRAVRGFLGVRTFRGLERADRHAVKLNRKAGR